MSELIQEFNDAQILLGFSPPRQRTLADISIAAKNLLASSHPADRDAVSHIKREFATRDLAPLRHSSLKQFSSHIAEKGILEWIQDVPPEHADSFMIWLRDRTEQLQRRLEHDKPQLDKLSEDYMNNLIKANIYPHDALSALCRSIKEIPLQALSTLESQGMLGYFDGERIGIADIYDDATTMRDIGLTLRLVSFHERDHTLGDLPLLINEVLASHHTAVAAAMAVKEEANPDTFDPDQRASRIGSEYYTHERHVFAEILSYTTLTPDILAKARLEGEGSSAYAETASELTSAFDNLAENKGAFHRLLHDYATATHFAQKQKILWDAYDILNPPLAI